jgi:nucleoside-diphosphate-sugar epimerase
MGLSGRRLLITGCNGFIGQALTKQCMEMGISVLGAFRSDKKIGYLPDWVEPVIVQEVGPQTDWTGALSGVTEIVHLAAKVHDLKKSGNNPREEYFRTNIAGTARLARAAADAGVRRMVFLSTIKVHGEGKEEPYTEADSTEAHDPYSISKLEAENVLREISSRSQLETVVLRPPLVYGPEVRANFLRLIQLVERRVPLPFAGVSNRRSLIFVENLVDAILICLKDPNAAGKTYLVADAERPSTPELITQIAEFLDVPVKLFNLPPSVVRTAAALFGRQKEADRLIGSLSADTSKIRREIGWGPRFVQREGLRATVEWYLQQKAALKNSLPCG